MHEHDDGEDDASLFRAAIGKVAPLRTGADAPPPRPKPRPARRPRGDEPQPGRTRIADHPDAALGRGDASAFRRERVPARAWQRLRRGEFAVQDELDLHGANAPTGLHGIVLREVEAPLFAEVMRYCGDNQTRAAELLGMTRATLRKKLREYGLAG